MADDEERPAGAGVGLVIGLVLAPLGALAAAGQMDPGEAGRVFGRVLFPVLAGSAVGTLLNRRREKRERH